MEEDRVVEFGQQGVRSFRHDEFDASSLVRLRRNRTVSVCLPARDEERTVGTIVSVIREHLTAAGGGPDLVDELIVVDDSSVDSTASVAEEAGATVISAGRQGGGKGEAMRVAIARSSGDLLVFLDADVENFSPHFVTGLLGPLLAEGPVESPAVAMVKGFYERPLGTSPSGGGRVTELVARPLIELLFPQLASVHQPLAGETAAPREVLERVGVAGGYGAEIGLLVDVSRRYGVDALAQVDLGVRIHRNRPLAQLRHQATDVIRAALERADIGGYTRAEHQSPG